MFSGLPKDSIKAVFSDFDDTLSEDSTIKASTLRALERLKEKKYFLAIVSGRPAGWADAMMRIFPIDAMVFENGAGVMWRDGDKITTETLAPTGQNHKARLEEVFQSIKKKIPHLKLATDQAYRLFDYAIDFTEEPPRLSESELELVMSELSKHADITHKLSSIHVNYWCGKQTKVTACEYLLKKFPQLGLNKDNVIYFGDSPNDEPLFEFFTHTVGVANIQKYLKDLKAKPRYLATLKGGQGFQQAVDYLVGSL